MQLSRRIAKYNSVKMSNVGTSEAEHSLRSQVGMGSESDCLFGQLNRILWTSDSEAGVKTEKSGEWQEERVSAEMI